MARPRKTVRDDDGQEVYGLSFTFDKKSNKHRYYLTGTKPRRWLGHDKHEAIRRFYGIKARETREMVAVGPGSDILEQLATNGTNSRLLVPLLKQVIHDQGGRLIDADHFYERMRDAITRNPKECAKKTGIPELAYLQKLDKPRPSLRLQQTVDLYLNRPTRKITESEQDKLASFWKEFADATGVTQIEDVTREAVEAWAARVSKAYIAGKGSPKSVIHKIGRVRTILKYASEKGYKDCTRVLGLVKAIDLPSAVKVAPKPISRDDYHALLKAADAKWRAMLLMAMNCCYYASDIRQVTKDVIDKETGEVAFPRVKNNVARVAMLWSRTRDALAETPEHNHPAVFISAVGRPDKSAGFRSAYDRLCAKAGVAPTFSQIRDGAYTAAIRGGVPLERAKMIAGHSTGMPDAYVLRGGVMVRGACEAIERAYFEG